MNKLGNEQQVAFVTGGSGFVGGRLIQALVARGWQVRALVRGQKAAASVAALGAVPVLGELTDQAALSKAMAGSKVVFHVAALFKMWGKQEEFNAVNVDGTRTLVEAAVDTPSVQKVIMVSAAGVVQGDPEPQVNIDERLPVQQRRFAPYSASKAAAEQILLAANGRREGFQTVALRPTMIWGTGMPMLDRMVEVVKAGNWQCPPDRKTIHCQYQQGAARAWVCSPCELEARHRRDAVFCIGFRGRSVVEVLTCNPIFQHLAGATHPEIAQSLLSGSRKRAFRWDSLLQSRSALNR